MKRVSLALSITLVSLFFSSCSKDKDDNDNGNNSCRITGATISGGGSTTTYVIAYNEQDKISSVQATANSVTSTNLFAYTGNVILVTHATAGTITSIDSVVLNQSGLLQYIKTRQVSDGSYSESVVNYQGEQITTVSSSQNGGTTSSQTAMYTNGNLTSLSNGSSIQTLDYDVSKPSLDGDYLKFSQLIQYGSLYIKTKNLLNKISGGGSTTSFSYTYDAEGKITGVQQSGTSIQTVSYVYSCN